MKSFLAGAIATVLIAYAAYAMLDGKLPRPGDGAPGRESPPLSRG